MNRKQIRAGAAALSAIGFILFAGLSGSRQEIDARVPTPLDTFNAMKAEVEALKGMAPDQSHAMADVASHASNLWFAGESGNWPLADFYFKETKSHLHWAVRIKPVRKDNANKDVNLVAILEALENGLLKQLGETIVAQDPQKFATAYKLTLDGCYACHKASEKPYLRLQIPRQPATPVINFTPSAGGAF